MSYNDASGGAGITTLDFVLTGLDERNYNGCFW